MRLKIFKVYADEDTRMVWEGNWYDEYFGHVVIAENKEEALDIAYDEGLIVPKYMATVEEVIPLEKCIVLSDFNAG